MVLRKRVALIEFKKRSEEARFRSPLEDFEEVSQRLEIRSDPLTGGICRINVERTKREKQTAGKEVDLERFVRDSSYRCPFCSGRLEESTPMFVRGLPSRIRRGEARIFPNLFPFAAFHAIGIFSDDHHLFLNEFTPKLLRDCFSGCLEYFRGLKSRSPELRYWYINWNWMPPGAASIVHPHVQIFADDNPTLHLRELLESSRRYLLNNRVNYWSDLIDAELRRDERYIGETDGVHWMAAFAPLADDDIVGIVEDVSSLSELDGELDAFCQGFSRILEGYHELGVRSMNFAFFSGPSDKTTGEYYYLNARLISRPSLAPFYVNDTGFMERLHSESIVETMPEDLARRMKRWL